MLVMKPQILMVVIIITIVKLLMSNIGITPSVMMLNSLLMLTVLMIGALKSEVNQLAHLLLSTEMLTGEVKESLLMTKSIA